MRLRRPPKAAKLSLPSLVSLRSSSRSCTRVDTAHSSFSSLRRPRHRLRLSLTSLEAAPHKKDKPALVMVVRLRSNATCLLNNSWSNLSLAPASRDEGAAATAQRSGKHSKKVRKERMYFVMSAGRANRAHGTGIISVVRTPVPTRGEG